MMLPPPHFWGRLASALLLLISSLAPLRAAEERLAGRNVLVFDVGPVRSAVADRAIALNPESDYSPEEGFGWTQRPQTAFNRLELTRSRSALTIDGVSGQRLAFQADVAPGKWHVILWLETGDSERQWPHVLVQGERQRLRWQSFLPPAEPHRAPPRQFRVFQSAANVEAAGLRIELAAAQENVRLLGISLIRQVSPTKPEQRAFLHQVEAAGDYHGDRPLRDLQERAETLLEADPNDAFFAIWQQRLDLVATAERYHAMRGWQWAEDETGLGIFDRQPQAVMLLDGFLLDDPAETKPLTERALYARGRLLYWMAKERGGAREFAVAAKDLEALAEKHPDDNILAMYTGQQIDLPDACDCLAPTAEAPAWANAEREALCRLRLLVHWWVRERQNEQGELGGKFGDDVEMLRWWAPLCLAGDQTALQGWQRLADGVWHSKHVYDGYAQKVADVEHAAEFIADTAPLMLVYSDDPAYEQRLSNSARHFETLWTGISAGGNRHFRSAWFSATKVDTEGPRGRDVEYNTRAVQALRYLAWRRPDSKLIRLLHEWSTAWANAALRTDKGKPKGIIPASIRYPDGAVNGDGLNWYQADMFWDFYEWQHYAGCLMLDQLLFTYTLTGDAYLLEPMFATLELIRSEAPRLSQTELTSWEEGSPAWVVARLRHDDLFWNVVEQWRDRSGDSRWDDLIRQYGTDVGRYQTSGDESYLVHGLEVLLKDVRYNTPLKTSEAIYTDRVRVANAQLLKRMLTGDGIEGNLSPYYAVSWQQTNADFTALVCRAGRNELEVELFSHGSADREVRMRVWQLTPGEYELRCAAHGAEPRVERVTISERGQRIGISVPARRLLNVSLQRSPQAGRRFRKR